VTKSTMSEQSSVGDFGDQEAAHVINEKALSKACIHKENELKTRPMKLEQYIYKRGRMY
jgi:hypothetical protein